LGVKKEHRSALMASLASGLFRHGKIQTTLTRAKALRPFAEKIITWAKKSALEEEKGKKLHFRRLALAKVRDGIAVRKLFDESVSLFSSRAGGYTRISKLMPRIGDAAPQAFIQYVDASVKSGTKRKKRSSATGKKSSEKVENVVPSPEPEVQESSVVSEKSDENLA
jgi:large subunit ribosomal protein L17